MTDVKYEGDASSTKQSLNSRTLRDVTLLHGQALVCRALIRGWQEPLAPSVSINPCTATTQTEQEEENW